MRLHPSPSLRHLEADRPQDRFWATAELVELIEGAAQRVARLRPGARLTVGELSARDGGRVPGHRSHQSGRDVDLGFYLVDEGDRAVEPTRFVPVRASGRGSWGGPVRFDDERNWRLVESLLQQDRVPVQHVFVAPTVRRRLLRTARRLGAEPGILHRAETVIRPPGRVGNPHRNHFHVRIYCPAVDLPDCRDRDPFWPWLPRSHPYAALVSEQHD